MQDDGVLAFLSGKVHAGKKMGSTVVVIGPAGKGLLRLYLLVQEFLGQVVFWGWDGQQGEKAGCFLSSRGRSNCLILIVTL